MKKQKEEAKNELPKMQDGEDGTDTRKIIQISLNRDTYSKIDQLRELFEVKLNMKISMDTIVRFLYDFYVHKMYYERINNKGEEMEEVEL